MHRFILSLLCVAAFGALYAFTGTSAALALLCASVIVPCASLALGAVCARGTKVSVSIPAGFHKGGSAVCSLAVENKSFVPAFRIELTLTVKNNLTGSEERLPILAFAPPFGENTLTFLFETVHCGQFVFEAETFRIYDFLGLRGIRKSFPIKEKRVALPDIFSLNVMLSGSETPLGGEMFSVPRKGQDRTEPFQIREYVEGDSPKQIHWKLTQKFGRYIVTDPSLELEQALLIVWDSGQISKDTPPEIPDALGESAISMCVELNGNGIPYSVIWKNGETGEIMLKDVIEEDDIFDVMLGLLSASSGAGESLIPEFRTLLDGKKYSQIAYFSCRLPKELDDLAVVGQTTAFLCCTDSETEAQDAVLFTPENYASILREIAI